jgi:hypothetical protein
MISLKDTLKLMLKDNLIISSVIPLESSYLIVFKEEFNNYDN